MLARKYTRKVTIFFLSIFTNFVPLSSVTASTHIQTDNTLSGITAFSSELLGNQQLFTMSEAQGQLAGSNLFYSFSQFNIGSGDTAWFNLNTPDLTHIISRVTGGNESFINGELKVTNAATGSTPSFFFINSSGITLGPGASVDVPGSFYVGTASNLHFSDGSQYQTNDSIITSSLTTAPPESFGFLGNETGNLNLSGTEADPVYLSFRPGSNVGLIANNIFIDHASINNNDMAQSGLSLKLIATGEQANKIELTGVWDQTTIGKLTVQDTNLYVSGNGSGRIAIRSGNFSATNSNIDASNTGNISMTENDGINIFVSSQTNLTNTPISSNALSAGNAGLINLRTNSLNLIDGGLISASTISQGDAGTVTVIADKLKIDGSPFLTGILSESGGILYGGIEGITGNAGHVSVTVSDTLEIMNSGRISTSTFSSGNAGAISIWADQLALSEAGMIQSNTFNTYGESGKGNAGDISVAVTGNIRIMKNSGIEANTFSDGNAGKVSVSSNNLEIEDFLSDISSISGFNIDKDGNFTKNAGNAGNVDVMISDTIKLSNGGKIRTGTNTEGKGGNINIAAKNIEIYSQESGLFTGIFSDSTNWDDAGNPLKGGNAGNATVTVADSLKLIGTGAQISTNTYSKGQAGKIVVVANQLDIDGHNAGIFSQSDSNNHLANTAVDVGDAGDIIVTANTLSLLNSGMISTSTSGSTGKAGTIAIDTEQLNINYSEISSSADSLSTGQTGSINIKANSDIQLSNNAKISINNEAITISPKAAAGNININLSDNSLFYLDNSSITTLTKVGDGGSITISGSKAAFLRNSPITTSVLGQSGNGGNINISSNTVILDNGFIQANTNGFRSNGGKITISESSVIIPSSNYLLIGGNQEDFMPFSGRNVIQAVAPNGQSVPPILRAPQLNLSSLLTHLSIDSIDTNHMSPNTCLIDDHSSLQQLGRGGQPLRSHHYLLTSW